jgi:P-type conjugative transfer protein TrbG
VFAGHYAQIGHQLRSTGKTPQVTNFSDDHRGRQQIYAAQGHQYPLDQLTLLQRQAQRADAVAAVAAGIALERLAFHYDVSGDAPPWRPLRAFDDGQRVYIQFPAGIAQGELPPLFVVGAAGGAELVNYRYRAPYYVVDRLFAAAELRLGSDKAQVVRVSRNDGGKR